MSKTTATDQIEAVYLGVDFSHPVDLIVNRPSGWADHWIVCCFTTPFWYRTDKEAGIGCPGDCMIIAPGEPHAHMTAPGETSGFRNDWIHIGGTEVGKAIERYELTTCQVLRTGDAQTIRPFLKRIQSEMYRQDNYHQDSIRLLVEGMLLEIARQSAITSPHIPLLTSSERDIRESFIHLRFEISASLDEAWPIEEMARRLHLSPSRFHEQYRRFFGVTPREDLLRVRIDHSRHLLAGTNATVAEVARMVGFSSPYYFSRTFHQRTGMTPSEYAKSFG